MYIELKHVGNERLKARGLKGRRAATSDRLEQPTCQQRPVTQARTADVSAAAAAMQRPSSGQAAAKQRPSSGSAVRACERPSSAGRQFEPVKKVPDHHIERRSQSPHIRGRSELGHSPRGVSVIPSVTVTVTVSVSVTVTVTVTVTVSDSYSYSDSDSYSFSDSDSDSDSQ